MSEANWGLWSEEGQDKAGNYLFSVCRNDAGPCSGFLSVRDDENHACIAEVRGKTKEEAKARAKLIAAAPDLLEALKQILRYADSSTDPGIIHVARTAIDKATS